MSDLIVDLFAGPGGWSEGLRELGLEDVGIEWDAAACKTRAAAGHLTIRADVAQYPAERFCGRCVGLIASPPCQDWSLAGKRRGFDGPSGFLVGEVLRWVRAIEPAWVACEQVPSVLPVWEWYADTLEELGYSTWAGVVNAADFGVPQSRKRAVLLATLEGVAAPPVQTHASNPAPGLFGPARAPWVTMADGIGWGLLDRPATTVVAGSNRTGGPASLDGGSGARQVYARARAEGRFVERTELTEWAWNRPATTVVASFCPDVIAAPGYRTKVSRQNAPGSVSVSVEEAAALQSFRDGYPWQGSESKQREQIGNAVPPRLARHLVAAIAGVERQEVAA